MTENLLTFEEEIFAEQALQTVSRSFALTIPQLPPALRPVVTNAYLLCRIVDTIEDEEGLAVERKREFFASLVSVLSGTLSARQFAESVSPWLCNSASPAEQDLVANTPMVVNPFLRFNRRQQDAIKRCVEVMSSGMLRFQQIRSLKGLPTLQDTTGYCYFVAGCVGEMLTELFCSYSPEIAGHRGKLFPLSSLFGKGLQMTNILKDLWEDRNRGVCWLPRDIFEQAGFSLSYLGPGHYHPAFGAGLAQLTGLTRFYLKQGLNYSLQIPAHETGIRKFCLWSIGMAVFTLRNINRKPDFQGAGEVKISRTIARSVIVVSSAMVRNNFMLQSLFTAFTWGLPDTDLVRHLLRPAAGRRSNDPLGQSALK